MESSNGFAIADAKGVVMTAQPLKVTLSKTSDGKHEFMQIISVDQVTLNIVLISPKIEIHDARPTGKGGNRR